MIVWNNIFLHIKVYFSSYKSIVNFNQNNNIFIELSNIKNKINNLFKDFLGEDRISLLRTFDSLEENIINFTENIKILTIKEKELLSELFFICEKKYSSVDKFNENRKKLLFLLDKKDFNYLEKLFLNK